VAADLWGLGVVAASHDGAPPLMTVMACSEHTTIVLKHN
jgi:hypothetical protein